PNLNRWMKEFPNSQLVASGVPVGLPEGVMGNSEVGHMHIGGGRRIPQDQVKINEAIKGGAFFKNPILLKSMERSKKNGSTIHLLGLVSQGNVHSSENHYLALIELFQKERILFHAILDGRDTPPKSAKGYLTTLEHKLAQVGGRIATVSGRFF